MARAGLLAAKEQRSVVGFAMPRGFRPHAWFMQLCQSADELVGDLPFFLCGEVDVVSGDERRARHLAYEMVDAGFTGLCLQIQGDLREVNGRAVAAVTQGAAERDLGVELIIPAQGGSLVVSTVAALVRSITAEGVAVDAVSVRCDPPLDAIAAEAQLGRLSELAATLAEHKVAVMRRGPLAAPLLSRLLLGGLAGYEDGGWLSAASLRSLSGVRRHFEYENLDGEALGLTGFERFFANPGDVEGFDAELGDRMEAFAHLEAESLLMALNTANSATRLREHLER